MLEQANRTQGRAEAVAAASARDAGEGRIGIKTVSSQIPELERAEAADRRGRWGSLRTRTDVDKRMVISAELQLPLQYHASRFMQPLDNKEQSRQSRFLEAPLRADSVVSFLACPGVRAGA